MASLSSKVPTMMTAASARVAADGAKTVGFSYLVPMVIFLLAPQYGFRWDHQDALQTPSMATATALAFENDPSQLIIRGTAYLWALGLFVVALPANRRVFTSSGAYIALSLYMLLSMAWSSYPAKVFINWGHLLGMSLVILASLHYFQRRPYSFYPTLLFLQAYPLFASLAVCLLKPDIGIGSDGRWDGIVGNANILGLISFTCLWSGVATLYGNCRIWMRVAVSGFLAAACVTLVGSRSATALVSTLVAATGMMFFIWMERDAVPRRVLKILVAVMAALVLAIVVLVVMPQLYTLKGALGAIGRDVTFSGRTKLWEAAWMLIHLKPLTGWSYDSNLSVIDYLQKTIGGVIQFHSGYLDLLVRGGVVGVALFFWLICRTLIMIRAEARQDYRQAMIFLSMVIAGLLYNVSEAAVVRETHVVWFLLLFIYFQLTFQSAMRKREEKRARVSLLSREIK